MLSAVALLVIFQPEIRRALAELGSQPLFTAPPESRSFVDGIVEAVQLLAERRIGALIAIERTISTKAIQDTGIKLDARVNAALDTVLDFARASDTDLRTAAYAVALNRLHNATVMRGVYP